MNGRASNHSGCLTATMRQLDCQGTRPPGENEEDAVEGRSQAYQLHGVLDRQTLDGLRRVTGRWEDLPEGECADESESAGVEDDDRICERVELWYLVNIAGGRMWELGDGPEGSHEVGGGTGGLPVGSRCRTGRVGALLRRKL